MIKECGFTPSIDSSGKSFRIIPTIEVFSNEDELMAYEEHLKNFNEDLCRKILVKHYGFSPTENLYGG